MAPLKDARTLGGNASADGGCPPVYCGGKREVEPGIDKPRQPVCAQYMMLLMTKPLQPLHCAPA
jgi:hypothetical protein